MQKQRFKAVTPVSTISLPRKNKPNTSANLKLVSKTVESQSDSESKSSGGKPKETNKQKKLALMRSADDQNTSTRSNGFFDYAMDLLTGAHKLEE